MAHPSAAPAAETPQLLKRAQTEFVASIVEQAARARPLILWIEDAHWLDPHRPNCCRMW
jgi:hypothetical protein